MQKNNCRKGVSKRLGFSLGPVKVLFTHCIFNGDPLRMKQLHDMGKHENQSTSEPQRQISVVFLTIFLILKNKPLDQRKERMINTKKVLKVVGVVVAVAAAATLLTPTWRHKLQLDIFKK